MFNRFVFVFLSFTMLSFSSFAEGKGAQDVKDVKDVKDTKDTNEKGCRSFVHESVREEFVESRDPFKRLILEGEKAPDGKPKCRRTENRFADVKQMLIERGCIFEGGDTGDMLVTEVGQIAEVKNPAAPIEEETKAIHRNVNVFQCPHQNDLDRLAEGTAVLRSSVYLVQFGGPNETDFEIAAFDGQSGITQFYTHTSEPIDLHTSEGNLFAYNGSGFRQATIELPGAHSCTRCHVQGGLLMKELRFPWVHWHNPIAGRVKGAVPLLERFGVEVDEEFPNQNLMIGEFMEIQVIRSQFHAVNAKIRGIQEGKRFAQPADAPEKTPVTLKNLLEPLFCESEVILASEKARSQVPADFYLNRLLVPKGRSKVINLESVNDDGGRLDMDGFFDDRDFGSFRPTSVPLATWKKTFEKLGVPNNPFAEAANKTETKFAGVRPFLIPARSFSDDHYVSRLVREGVIEEKLAVAALMVDFSNPVFSPLRCGLLEVIPADVTVESFRAAGKEGEAGEERGEIQPERITAFVLERLNSKSVKAKSVADTALPLVSDYGKKKVFEKARAELAASLQKEAQAVLDESATRVSKYLDACTNSFPRGEGEDIESAQLTWAEKLYQTMRARRLLLLAFRPEVEHFVHPAFPEGIQGAKGGESLQEEAHHIQNGHGVSQIHFGLDQSCGFQSTM